MTALAHGNGEGTAWPEALGVAATLARCAAQEVVPMTAHKGRAVRIDRGIDRGTSEGRLPAGRERSLP